MSERTSPILDALESDVSFSFPSGDNQHILSLDISLNEFAGRYGLTVQEGKDDAPGPYIFAAGFYNSEPIYIEQFTEIPESNLGIHVYVDSKADQTLPDMFLQSLRLPQESVLWRRADKKTNFA